MTCVNSGDKAKAKAFDSMPAYIDYDQDGYKGKLYPVPNSLEGGSGTVPMYVSV